MSLTTTSDQEAFALALYWANKPIKKFVATLLCRESGKTESRIFAASSSDRVSELALNNTDLKDPVVREIRLASPKDLGAEPATTVFNDNRAEARPQDARISAMADAEGLQQFSVPGMTGQMYLLGNAPAIAAVGQLQEQHRRLTSALADCLAMMQRAEQHQKHPTEWNDPVGIAAWDIAAIAGQLVLKEACHAK